MDYLKAFLVGGIICAIAQVLLEKAKMTPAKILVTFVTSGVFLTAIGIYEKLVEFAGAGATIPITGFGYTMAKGTVEFIKKQGIVGIFSGGLASASAGIAAAVFFGYLATLISSLESKIRASN